MPLQSRTIGLRNLVSSDYAPLYQILENVHTFRNLGRTLPPENFPQFIWEGVYAQKIIHFRDKRDGCLGLISIINVDIANGIGYFSVLVDSEAAPDTTAGEALVLFLRHIFTTTPLRKVYAETSAKSMPWIHSAAVPVRGMHLEGVLRGHLLVGQQPEDVYMYAFWRQDFMKETEHLARAMSSDQIVLERNQRPTDSYTEFLGKLNTRFSDWLDLGAGDGGLRLVEDLGIDSFLLLEIIVWMEEHYRIVISDEAMVHVENLSKLYSLIPT